MADRPDGPDDLDAKNGRSAEAEALLMQARSAARRGIGEGHLRTRETLEALERLRAGRAVKPATN